ncbi:acyl carrier protein [Clostridium sp. E02]|uniref:acyl carrier protein n=1 Tax=Clostridium sp. E02 TaxID=2487134 RepID=UPI000F53E4A9|nr:acyl carrier protein [Clostridium sp. E02]
MNNEFYCFMCETLNKLTGSTIDKYNIEADLSTFEINSLLFIKLIVEIEEKYGFEFDDEYLILEKMNTINAIYLITQKYVDGLKQV